MQFWFFEINISVIKLATDIVWLVRFYGLSIILDLFKAKSFSYKYIKCIGFVNIFFDNVFKRA